MKVDYKLFTKNEWSRPGRSEDMQKIKKIVLHWFGNPKQTAYSVWQFFENRKYGKTGFGSAHFMIDLDGTLIQGIPQEEMAYHVGSKTYTEFGLSISSYPNNSTLGIEMAHTTWEGEYTDNTWDTGKIIVYLLLKEYGLDIDDITTHHAVVGWKECPRYFCLFPDEFERFREEVQELFHNHVIGYVNVDGKLNLRNYPMGAIVSQLMPNDKLLLIGYKDGWYKIRKDNNVGYVSAKYVEIL